jgi:putative peptide zinc metalloprotease protein
LGLEQPESPFLPQRNRFFFGLYTIAAEIYRLMVVFSILFFLNKVFEPYGLKIIGQLIGFTGVIGLFVQPLYQLFQFFYIPGRMNKVKKNRVYVTIGVAIAVILMIIFIPLPFSVNCSFEVVPRDAANVFAPAPGFLTTMPMVKPGDQVKQGDVIAVLSNPDLELQMREREGSLEKAKISLNNILKLMSKDIATYSAQKPAAMEVVNTAEKLYKETKEEFEKLTIKAPRDGVIIPPPYKNNKQVPEGRLSTWTGSLFEQHNLGARVERSDLICRVGDTKQMEAMLVIDQADVELVQKGHKARLVTEAYVYNVYEGEIESIADIDLKQSPAGLSTQAGGDLNTKMDASGMPRPISTSYQARIPLTDNDGSLFVGLRGHARVYTGWQSAGERLFRYVIRTFHFHL